MDPFGNIPFFITALKNVPAPRRAPVMIRELSIALAVLVLFLFCGHRLLAMLDITETALTISGGVILFLIALKMVFPEAPRSEPIPSAEPFIVPLAIPLIAGPSAMSAVLLIMSRDAGRWHEWLIAIIIAWAMTATILFGANALSRFLGERVLTAVERLMGMLLVTLAVQLSLTGFDQFLARIYERS